MITLPSRSSAVGRPARSSPSISWLNHGCIIDRCASSSSNADAGRRDQGRGRHAKGGLGGTVEIQGHTMVVDGREIAITQEPDPARLKWGEFGVDIVLESVGTFTRRAQAALHLQAGALGDLLHGLALRQLHTHVAVAALGAGAGGNHVPHPGKAGEGWSLPAHGDSEARDFGEAARDQGGARVVASLTPVKDKELLVISPTRRGPANRGVPRAGGSVTPARDSPRRSRVTLS